MKFKLYSKIGAALAVASAFLFASVDAVATINGRWVSHPAAALRSPLKQSQVDRIIEGNRYVYFSVRGAYFNRNIGYTIASGYNIDPIQLFRYDKSLTWGDANIKPVAQEVEMAGALPVALNYSPVAGVMAVAYENRKIDFIYDNDVVVSTPVLCDVSMAGVSTVPYTFSFDEERGVVYVAGSYGYVVIDYNDGTLKEIHDFGKPISWVNRVGDKIVLFAGKMSTSEYSTSTYIFPVNNVPSQLPLPIAGAENLQALMPISSNTFAAIVENGSYQYGDLRLYTISSGGVSSKLLLSNMEVDDAAQTNFRHMFRTDGYFSQATDGYFVYCKDYIVKIVKGEKADVLTLFDRTTLSESERFAKAATLDGSILWLYKYDNKGEGEEEPRGFYTYGHSNGEWASKSELAAPMAPTSIFAKYAEYNPLYGLMFRSAGSSYDQSEPDFDRLFAYKDGKWIDFSMPAHNARYSTPMVGGKEAKTDPLNPAWIWGCSSRRGIHRTDLENYENFFELGTQSNASYVSTYPGYFAYFNPMPAWDVITDFALDFDSDGTLWFNRYYNQKFDKDYKEKSENYTPLYFLTKEERKSISHIGDDRSKLPDILGREIRIYGSQSYPTASLKALKYPSNKNILVGQTGYYNSDFRRFFIYDHNGTPGNPEDDRYQVRNDIRDENGERIVALMETGLYEDMNSGNIWYLTTSGPFIINPQEFLKGDHRCRRFRILRREGMDVNENPFEHISIYNITDDNLGRKWMATENGLYCLSPDGLELLAHFTIDNSPLPTNNLVNVAFNPETGSIFVMSTRGMVEFQPEGSIAPTPEGNHLSIWPTALSQDYRGYMNITGCVGGTEYIITDSEGNEVKALGYPDAGALQWDGRNSSGKRVSSGRYNVTRRGMNDTHPVYILE